LLLLLSLSMLFEPFILITTPALCFILLDAGDSDFRDIKTKLIDSAAPTSNSTVTFDNNQRKLGSGCCS
jgi:hypothetical protein